MNPTHLYTLLFVCFHCNFWPVSSSSNAEPVKYVLTFSSIWRLAKDFEFQLVLFENSNYSLPVTFVANLSINDNTIASQSFVQNQYGLQLHTFKNVKLPSSKARGGGDDDDDDDDEDGEALSPTVTVTFTSSGMLQYGDISSTEQLLAEQFVFIQTDKAIYKPAQNVKIRVLALDRELKALSSVVTLTVEDARGNTIQQWTNQSLQHGMLALNFTMSDFASLGDWTVTVDGNNQLPKTSKTFSVQQYVLPKYEVHLDFPSNLWLLSTKSDAAYKGYVRAKYTFGKPVRGTASVALSSTGGCVYLYDSRTYYNSINTTVPPLINITMSLAGDGSSDDGSFTLNGLNTLLRQGSTAEVIDFSFTQCELKFAANVTEALTGETITAIGGVTLYRSPYSIKVHPSVQKSLKPGLPFTMRFQVTKPDGSPLDKSVDVAVQVYTDLGPKQTYAADNCYTLTYFSNDLNMSRIDNKTYSLTTDSNGLASITVATPQNAASVAFYATVADDPKVTACESRSPPNTASGQSVSISIDRPISESTVIPKVGDTLKFKIYVSFVTSYVYFLMSQNGKAFMYKKLTAPQPSSEGANVSVFVESIELSSSFAPRVSAVAWTVEENANEVLADAVDFKVDGFIQQSVSASFIPSSVRPGEATVLNVKTSEPNCAVALLAVDKSVRLLKSGNDISLDDVLVAVGGGADNSGNSYYSPVAPLLWRCWDCDWWPYWADSSSADAVFRGVGMVISSNAAIKQDIPVIDFDMEDDAFGGDPGVRMEKRDEQPAPPVMPMMASNTANLGSKVTANNRKSASDSPMRTNFPESWIWQTVVTGSSMELQQTFMAPDTVTTWVLSALAVGDSKGFGALSKPSELTVFQDFFVNLDVSHPTIIRGEQVEIKAVVFNYESKPLTVNLSLMASPDFDASQDGGKTFSSLGVARLVTVPANGGSSVPVWIKPKKLGSIFLLLSGVAELDGSTVRDAMKKEVTVEAEGEVKYANMPLLVKLNTGTSDQSQFTQTIQVDDLLGKQSSNSIVNGSKLIQLQAIGDILGPSLANLGSQIRLPTGCGEQTMIILAPNVYIYKYLKSAGVLSADTASQALGYVDQGYRRELGYQRVDGGFSAFGNSDQASSTWLTAFVLRCFHAATKYMNTGIDGTVFARPWDFLKNLAQPNGTFAEFGRVIHYSMKGGATSNVNLAIYIYTTFAEAGGAVDYAWSSLAATRNLIISTASAPTNNDTYQLAIAAYALSMLPGDKASSLVIIDKLKTLATVEGGTMNWATQQSKKQTDDWSDESGSSDVETAAYALLAMLNNGQNDSAISIARYLLSKRNSLGGFISTQDTVVGLQALSEIAPVLSSKSTALDVVATFNFVDGNANQVSTSFRIDKSNAQILQSFDPDRSRQMLKSVDIVAKGSGVALLQLAIRYNVMSQQILDSGDFTVKVIRHITARKKRQADDNNSTLSDENVQLKACIRPVTEKAKIGMVVLEVGVPTGFDIALPETQKANTMNSTADASYVAPLKRIEAGDRKIVFYFDSLDVNDPNNNNGDTCVIGVISRKTAATNVQPPMSRVYAYYSPSMFKAEEFSFPGMSSNNE